MLRRDKTDELYTMAVKRCKSENPNIKLTNQDIDSIWYTIYGIMCREGEEAARKYVESSKVLIGEITMRGYC